VSFPIGKRAMASASVSSVSGISAVLNLDDGEFKALTVLKFRYEEELGQPFAVEIELQSTSGVLAELKKLGSSVNFVARAGRLGSAGTVNCGDGHTLDALCPASGPRRLLASRCC
jgi:hypothetical protein